MICACIGARACGFRRLTDSRSQAGVRYVFANFGSDHPAIMEAMVKGKEERGDKFPKFITCPNEVRCF